MKRTKEFNNILNDCLERLLLKGDTLEQCLADYPEQASALEPLLATAITLKQASVIQPRPEFKAEASHQFRAALQGMTPKRGFFPLAWPRWATAAAVVLVLFLVGGSTVVVANGSMPDEPLYPIKLATEQARLTFTLSDIKKAELHADLADRWVAEIVSMVNEGKPEYLERVTDRFDDNLVMIAVLARAQAGEEKAALAPAPLPSPLTEASRDTAVSSPDYRLDRLRMAVARYADSHPEALRERLQTAPDWAKPALRRAITIAEVRYQQALEAVDERRGDR